MTEAIARAEIPEHGRAIVEIARSWIGTPYEHQASCAGAGADCLGLLRGIWRALAAFSALLCGLVLLLLGMDAAYALGLLLLLGVLDRWYEQRNAPLADLSSR